MKGKMEEAQLSRRLERITKNQLGNRYSEVLYLITKEELSG
jgi:hypothetical protein